jgi:DNA polymerase III subunit delta'
MPFREVVGHRRLLTLISRAIARDTLIPSLIFSGPEGVGKRLTAIAVAQALNCSAAEAAPYRNRTPVPDAAPGVGRNFSSAPTDDDIVHDACGKCPACRRIARGAYPDVQMIEPGETGSIKIEQVRAVIDQAMFRPFEGRRRVTIIAQAEALVPAAQNALLKTLEEPLASSVFILVTSRPDALLPTVRSRCAHLRFGRLPAADVAVVLERGHGYARQEALAAAAASDGSIHQALNLEAEEYVEARGDAEDLLSVAGRDPRTRLEQARGLLKGEGSAPAERDHLAMRLEALSSVLRDVGVLASGADSRLVANIDRRSVLDKLARTLDRERVEKTFAAVTSAHEALERNVGPKVVADWLAIQL